MVAERRPDRLSNRPERDSPGDRQRRRNGHTSQSSTARVRRASPRIGPSTDARSSSTRAPMSGRFRSIRVSLRRRCCRAPSSSEMHATRPTADGSPTSQTSRGAWRSPSALSPDRCAASSCPTRAAISPCGYPTGLRCSTSITNSCLQRVSLHPSHDGGLTLGRPERVRVPRLRGGPLGHDLRRLAGRYPDRPARKRRRNRRRERSRSSWAGAPSSSSTWLAFAARCDSHPPIPPEQTGHVRSRRRRGRVARRQQRIGGSP